MTIPQHAIEEFKAIWREDVGEEISDDEARAAGLRLLWLFDRLSHPPRHEDCGKGSNAHPLDGRTADPENEKPSQ